MTRPRHRLAVDTALAAAAALTLEGNPAHYLSHVLRLQAGDVIAVFNRTDGEWCARISEVNKRNVVLTVERALRPPTARGFELTVCFAPIKGGRMETIIEKATELGASVLQPVITQRTIVDKVNLERAYATAREAAEQCERTDWPEIREPVKLLNLLGSWPADMPLIYGDESGDSPAINTLLSNPAIMSSAAEGKPPIKNWAILTGPEGGFTPEEFAALSRVKGAHGTSLGPRILRADTAVITLCVATTMAWGDWAERPRFVAGGDS